MSASPFSVLHAAVTELLALTARVQRGDVVPDRAATAEAILMRIEAAVCEAERLTPPPGVAVVAMLNVVSRARQVAALYGPQVCGQPHARWFPLVGWGPTPASGLEDELRTLAQAFDRINTAPTPTNTAPTPTNADDLLRLVTIISGEHAGKIFTIARNPKLTVDQKQRTIYAIDSTALAWTGKRWSDLLEVTEQAATKTPWWMEDRKRRQAD